jgi:hypothetical protein
MGYRSDVAYVIKFEDIEKRDAFVSLMLAKNEQHITQALDEVKHDYKTEAIITFEAQGQKWYDSYPDVQVHHQLMSDAAALFDGEYRFVRIGEDVNDIDVQEHGHNYDLWEYVEPVTTLRINF